MRRFFRSAAFPILIVIVLAFFAQRLISGPSSDTTPTYDQFASGYANTQHDDISFGTITPNADGTVTVDLTILATETTSTGTVKSAYQGSYIVGQQNGAWKLLKGNFSKV